MNYDWLIYYVECSNVSTTNFNVKKGLTLCIFIGDVHCTSIYRLLSCPFRSLFHIICSRRFGFHEFKDLKKDFWVQLNKTLGNSL